MTLIDLRNVLLTIGVPVYHYEAHRCKGRYIVWAEDGEGNSLHADGKKTEQVIQGTIDFFTNHDFDPTFQAIQEKLNSCDELTWRLNSTQYEKDTGYIHYEWIWGLV